MCAKKVFLVNGKRVKAWCLFRVCDLYCSHLFRSEIEHKTQPFYVRYSIDEILGLGRIGVLLAGFSEIVGVLCVLCVYHQKLFSPTVLPYVFWIGMKENTPCLDIETLQKQ